MALIQATDIAHLPLPLTPLVIMHIFPAKCAIKWKGHSHAPFSRGYLIPPSSSVPSRRISSNVIGGTDRKLAPKHDYKNSRSYRYNTELHACQRQTAPLTISDSLRNLCRDFFPLLLSGPPQSGYGNAHFTKAYRRAIFYAPHTFFCRLFGFYACTHTTYTSIY